MSARLACLIHAANVHSEPGSNPSKNAVSEEEQRKLEEEEQRKVEEQIKLEQVAEEQRKTTEEEQRKKVEKLEKEIMERNRLIEEQKKQLASYGESENLQKKLSEVTKQLGGRKKLQQRKTNRK